MTRIEANIQAAVERLREVADGKNIKDVYEVRRFVPYKQRELSLSSWRDDNETLADAYLAQLVENGG